MTKKNPEPRDDEDEDAGEPATPPGHRRDEATGKYMPVRKFPKTDPDA